MDVPVHLIRSLAHAKSQLQEIVKAEEPPMPGSQVPAQVELLELCMRELCMREHG